jgi:crossover junction endodeoxyribonuclease RuvC
MANRVMGLDPSISSTGWAVKIDEDIVDLGRITTTNKSEEDERIFQIAVQILQKAREHKIDAVIMESQFVYRNAKTALQLSRLRGGIVVLLKMANISVKYISPSEIKQAVTGNGKAEKEDVAATLLVIYKDNEKVQNIGPFSDKSNKQKTSDIYDAVAAVYSYKD